MFSLCDPSLSRYSPNNISLLPPPRLMMSAPPSPKKKLPPTVSVRVSFPVWETDPRVPCRMLSADVDETTSPIWAAKDDTLPGALTSSGEIMSKTPEIVEVTVLAFVTPMVTLSVPVMSSVPVSLDVGPVNSPPSKVIEFETQLAC